MKNSNSVKLTEYAQTARPVALHEVASLDHKVSDHPVKSGVFVPDRHLIEPKLSGAQLPEVFLGFRRHVLEQFEFNAPDVVPAHLDVDENDRIVGIAHGTVLLPGLCHLNLCFLF